MNSSIRTIILALLVTLSLAQKPVFPAHWGNPPEIETMDFLTLPAGFGQGSSSKKNWIIEHMKEDIQTNHPKRVVNSKGPWPEFVGMKGSDAKHRLWLDTGLAEILVLKVNTPVTRDYKPNRVRIFIGDDGNVAKVPNRG